MWSSVFLACASLAGPGAGAVPDSAPAGQAVASAAGGLVGAALPAQATGPADGSDLVRAAYAELGDPLQGSDTPALYALAKQARVLHHRRRPSPGDVAFFDDTWDVNGDGQVNDPLSHAAVVESVDAEGTISLVHRGPKGVTRFSMNLYEPQVIVAPDKSQRNSYLRSYLRDDPRGTLYLSGQLFVGFGSLWER